MVIDFTALPDVSRPYKAAVKAFGEVCKKKNKKIKVSSRCSRSHPISDVAQDRPSAWPATSVETKLSGLGTTPKMTSYVGFCRERLSRWNSFDQAPTMAREVQNMVKDKAAIGTYDATARRRANAFRKSKLTPLMRVGAKLRDAVAAAGCSFTSATVSAVCIPRTPRQRAHLSDCAARPDDASRS